MAATRGHWRSTRPKVPCTAMYTNPGPKYAVPSGLMSASTGKDRNETLYESPAYTIGSGHNTNFKTLGPGPAAYKPDPKYTHQGKAGGPYAFATWKPKDPLERRGPGPTDYDTSHIKENAWSKLKGAPAASLGSRNKGPRMSGGPGPSAYNIEKKQLDLTNYKSPEIVMGSRWNDTNRWGPPGPGTYGDPAISKYKKGTPPAYSMGGKWKDVSSFKTPSPNVYATESGSKRTKKQAPAFSFGNHHSDFASAVVTKDDVDGDCGVCQKDDYCRDTAPPKPDGCPPVEC